MSDNLYQTIPGWWTTEIFDMDPDVMDICGRSIEELIRNITSPQMIWICLRGDLPSEARPNYPRLHWLNPLITAHTPSLALARVAISCDVGINDAMASAIKALCEVHGA